MEQASISEKMNSGFGSFKIRGAYYAISQLTDADKANGVVCASAGNHAQGVAYTC